MHLDRFLTSVVLCGVFGRVIVVVGETVHETHKAAAITGRAEADAAATITLGPIESYSATAKPSTSLTGLQLVVEADPEATGIPPDGINAFLSDELSKNAKAAVAKSCGKDIDATCQREVQAVLQHKDVQLRARQIGVLALLIGGVALWIAIVIPHIMAQESYDVPGAFHIPPADLSQISAIGTRTEIHVATTSGDSIVTVTDAPRPSTAAGAVPSISTVEMSSEKLAKGDVVVSLPKDLVPRLQDFIAMESVCTQYRKIKRAIDALCLQGASQNLVINAIPGGPLEGLFFAQGLAFRIGGVARQEYVEALRNVQQFAIGLAPRLKIDNTKAAAFGALAFAMVYKVYIDGQTLTEENVFASNEVDIAPITASPTTTSADACPSDAPKTDGPEPLCCQFDDCKGDEDLKLCETGKWKGCPCLNLVSYPPPDEYDPELLSAQAVMLAEVFGSAKETTSTRWCRHAAAPRRIQGNGWCECGDGKSYSATSMAISTTNSAGSSTVIVELCPYTTAPTATYEVTPVASATSTAAPSPSTTTQAAAAPSPSDECPDDQVGLRTCEILCQGKLSFCVGSDQGNYCSCTSGGNALFDLGYEGPVRM
ncbi:MAG: hypothetical protein M1817_006233 [Caeruleum heppii]|nr:MAG: hypothetical protein M1817_006233 [Caeruleum heppii]